MGTYYTANYISPTTYYSWTGLNTENQVASPITFPTGRVTNISIHAGGYGGTAPAFHALWMNQTDGGALLGRSDTISWANGRAWRSMPVDINVSSGITYYIGFYCNPSYERQWSENANAGYQYRKTSTSIVGMDGAKTYSQSAGGDGAICAYATVTEGHIWINISGSWVRGVVWVYNGGWKQAQTVWTYNAGWKPNT